MKKKLKLFVLKIIKAFGGFHFARILTKRKLRILCYHGFSINDQHLFEDILFIRKETFNRRMLLLKKWGMKVISLQEAVEALPLNKHPDHSLVITFDDGWYSTMQALPALTEQGFPSTIYIASYYALKNVGVFNVLIEYMFWKTQVTKFLLSDLSPAIDGEYDLTDSEQKIKACQSLITLGNNGDIDLKDKISKNCAKLLGIDLSSIESTRMFHYMTVDEMRTLEAHKMSLELHTHRHVFPMNQKGVEEEIANNRQALALVRPGNYEHFCYPSGLFSEFQFPWLQALGIKSATTTNNNFNTHKTPLLQLDRFLDRENHSDLEFEAEICGVTQALRSLFFLQKNY